MRRAAFRHGMTVGMKGQPNGTSVGIGLPTQFASAVSGEAIPRGLKTTADAQRWLEIARTDMLAALGGPKNRLLDAWVAAHKQTLARGNCPQRDSAS